MFKFFAAIVAVSLVSINFSSVKAEEEQPAAQLSATQYALQGRALCEQGHEEEGITLLREGYNIHHNPALLLYIARCHQVTGNYCDTAVYLQNYLVAERLGDQNYLSPPENIEREISGFVGLCQQIAIIRLVEEIRQSEQINFEPPEEEEPVPPEPVPDPVPQDPPAPELNPALNPPPEPPTPATPEPSRWSFTTGWSLFGAGLSLLLPGVACWIDAEVRWQADPYIQPDTAFWGDGLGISGALVVGTGIIFLIYYYTRLSRWREQQETLSTLRFRPWWTANARTF